MSAQPKTGIVVQDLVQRFGGQTSGQPPVDVLAGLSLDVPQGGFVSLIGPSGCGKSTVLRILAGLLHPTAGDAWIDGRSTAGVTGLAAFMPQRDSLLPWRRALSNATVGAEIAGIDKASARAEAAELFVRFGLGGFERAWPQQLSGGMRQRVALLRTLLVKRDVLLLDEPFGALDAITRRELQSWLAALLTEHRRTTLLVTHDVDEALLLSDEVIVLSQRPAAIRLALTVPLDRPRHVDAVTNPILVACKAQILAALTT